MVSNPRETMSKKYWIKDALKNRKPGALHKALGVPMGERIPLAKLRRAAKSGGPKTRKRAQLALTMRSFRKH